MSLKEDESSPFALVSNPHDPHGFIGDNPARGHGILWNKEKYLASKGGIPALSESASVVVIGGGLSGLSAAHALSDLNPVLLEQAPRFGGNAKGERWGDLEYSIGSAYITKPEEGSKLHGLLDELGLYERLRFERAEKEAVFSDGKIQKPFWSGVSDPNRAAEFKRVYETLLGLAERYPAIPAKSQTDKARLLELDRLTFADWVRANLGAIHPHIEELFHEYCWDAFGAGYNEISAAHALNFLVADLGTVAAFPGGNAALAEALYRRLQSKLPARNLRSGCFAVDIAVEKGLVRVTYENAEGKLVSVGARSCVVATPKFIAGGVVSGLPQAQAAAIRKLRYRAFLVANVLVDGQVASENYGAFHLRGSVPADPREEGPKRAYTSVIFGGWAGGNHASRSTLTLYKSFPYDGARGDLFRKNAHAKAVAAFEKELPELLKAAGVPKSSVVALRISRWGHALPLAAAGLLADGTWEAAAKPVGGRIFFGQQDNWGSPCVESALDAALEAAGQARQVSQSSAVS